MAVSSRPAELPELDADAVIAVRDHINRTLPDLLGLIISREPLLMTHHSSPPPSMPRSGDEALELLHASAHAESHLHRVLKDYQKERALDAVLRGVPVTEVARALGVSTGTISKRWPFLGKLRRNHMWFRSRDNARAWAMACVAMGPVATSISFAAEVDIVPGFGVHQVNNMAALAQSYLAAETAHSNETVFPQWLGMVRHTPPIVTHLANPRMATGTTDDAIAALDQLRLVWRACRAEISVQDQIERDKQDRNQQRTAAGP